MTDLLALAVAGALGSVCRFLLCSLSYRVRGEGCGYGTLVVNMIGCFALTFFMHTALVTDLVPRTLRIAVAIGFLGAFTTFSTFGFETLRYLDDGDWALAATNVVANVVLCLIASWAGLTAGRIFIGGV